MGSTMEGKILVARSSMPPFEEYAEMIKPLWESHWLTNMGKYHNELESQLMGYLGVDYLSLTVNGHMALELAIQSMDFPKGSEVITTPFTFVSTTHAIIRNGLVPVFCDIKETDFTIDENKIEDLITEKTVAIVPVHVYGNICSVDKIEHIAKKHNLKVIYDAAHAFGETYNGKGIGTYGDLSVFSFHATKVYNTIEGGAICCHSQEQYDKLYNLKNFGIRSEELVVSVGANAKMNEFQAAMGLCNLKYIDGEIAKREHIADLYISKLKNLPDIYLNYENRSEKSNYSYFPVLFENKEVRDKVYNCLKANNIYSRKYFYPITADDMFFGDKYKKEPLDTARNVSDRVLVLPMYADMKKADIDRITGIIQQII